MFDPNLMTAVFIGRSGCGKGTQANLLIDYLKANYGADAPILYVETGARFRDFITKDSFSSRRAKELMNDNELQPSFLSTFMWANELIDKIKEDQHLVIDGSPRKLTEAQTLASALRFYGRFRPTIIHLNVSRDWSLDRLSGRGRSDDDLAGIEKRLDWFEAEVAPAIEFFKNDGHFSYLDINGEQSIEEVHQSIVLALTGANN